MREWLSSWPSAVSAMAAGEFGNVAHEFSMAARIVACFGRMDGPAEWRQKAVRSAGGRLCSAGWCGLSDGGDAGGIGMLVMWDVLRAGSGWKWARSRVSEAMRESEEMGSVVSKIGEVVCYDD